MPWIVMSPAPVEKGRRTLRWKVTSPEGALLGFIEWHCPWRCYAFFPEAETLYEKACLRDLSDFCEQTTRDHMSICQRRRTSGRLAPGSKGGRSR